MPLAEKERLQEELGHARLYGRNLEVNGKFVSEFVTPMLYDMGVAEMGVGENRAAVFNQLELIRI
jgi:hypothetical protein